MFRHRSEDPAGLAFDPTRWDLVRLASNEDPSEQGRRQAAHALNDLCRIYHAPILAYLSRRARTPQDAEDLAQEFFARRISPEMLATADAEKGRFRALLLATLKNFVRDHADHHRAKKRGGHIKFVPLQEGLARGDEPSTLDDHCFDASWANTVVERALARLRRSFKLRGETNSYDVLVPFIGDRGEGTELHHAAKRLGISLNALQIRLSRFRSAYAKYVREELARTVASPAEVEPEIRYLLEVLAVSAR